jgi:hypothetical protein
MLILQERNLIYCESLDLSILCTAYVREIEQPVNCTRHIDLQGCISCLMEHSFRQGAQRIIELASV